MKKGSTSRKNKGQTLLIIVLLFSAAATTIVLGAVSPLIRQIQVIRNLEASKKSYFAAEAGIEDAVYRLKSALAISGSESIDFPPGGTALTTITGTAQGKNLAARGDVSGAVRKWEVGLKLLSGPEGQFLGYDILSWKEVK